MQIKNLIFLKLYTAFAIALKIAITTAMIISSF